MLNKDYRLYGTKILNQKTKEVGLLICIWKNKFADAEVDYAIVTRFCKKNDEQNLNRH